jgi:hypothetical protein
MNDMRKQTLFLYLILCVSAIIMAMPASAAEVTITFDDHTPSLQVNTPLTTQYASQGVTFSGARVVDTDSTSRVDLGFAPTSTSPCRLDFSPYVTSVSLQFEDALTADMDGILVNGNKVSDFDFIWQDDTLHVSSSASKPIMYVIVSSGTTLGMRSIQFDNLRYTQIPEFPTAVVPVAAVLGLLLIFQRRKN